MIEYDTTAVGHPYRGSHILTEKRQPRLHFPVHFMEPDVFITIFSAGNSDPGTVGRYNRVVDGFLRLTDYAIDTATAVYPGQCCGGRIDA